MSKRIEQLTTGQTEADDLLADLVDLGTQKILQEGLEAEVDQFLDRGWYERSGSETPKGYRNGYRPDPLELSQLKHLPKTMISEKNITTENNKISYQLVA